MTCERDEPVRDDAEKKSAPAARGLPKKHPCPDCRFCQMCSDSRCNSCRSDKGGANAGCSKKLSFSEQIRLYEETNKKDPFIRKRST